MPNFNGVRKTRWYQAEATLRAITETLANGKPPAPGWTPRKMLRLAQDITDRNLASSTLHEAADALQLYLTRELAADRQKNLLQIVKYAFKAWRNK